MVDHLHQKKEAARKVEDALRAEGRAFEADQVRNIRVSLATAQGTLKQLHAGLTKLTAERKSVKLAATVLLEWIDKMEDPTALALAIAQADELAEKARALGNEEAAKHAFARRFVESIALDNAGMMRLLSEKAHA